MAEKIDRLLEKEADLVEKLKTLRKEKSRIASEKKKAIKKEENRENFVLGQFLRRIIETGEDKNHPSHVSAIPIYNALMDAKSFLSESEQLFLAQSRSLKLAFLLNPYPPKKSGEGKNAP